MRKKIILIQKLKNGDHKRQEEFGEEDWEGEREEGEGEEGPSLENEFDQEDGKV